MELVSGEEERDRGKLQRKYNKDKKKTMEGLLRFTSLLQGWVSLYSCEILEYSYSYTGEGTEMEKDLLPTSYAYPFLRTNCCYFYF